MGDVTNGETTKRVQKYFLTFALPCRPFGLFALPCRPFGLFALPCRPLVYLLSRVDLWFICSQRLLDYFAV